MLLFVDLYVKPPPPRPPMKLINGGTRYAYWVEEGEYYKFGDVRGFMELYHDGAFNDAHNMVIVWGGKKCIVDSRPNNKVILRFI